MYSFSLHPLSTAQYLPSFATWILEMVNFINSSKCCKCAFCAYHSTETVLSSQAPPPSHNPRAHFCPPLSWPLLHLPLLATLVFHQSLPCLSCWSIMLTWFSSVTLSQSSSNSPPPDSEHFSTQFLSLCSHPPQTSFPSTSDHIYNGGPIRLWQSRRLPIA